MSAMRQAIVLFGHGARDPRWREPFDRLHARLSALRPDCVVRLAFLELMAPSLAEAIDALAAEGIDAVTVVPVFLGQGGHLRRDFPLLVEECRARHPGVDIGVATAVGEADVVVDAMAAYCAQAVSPGNGAQP
ncbi:sirohydrochlorin chelatase [Cupriavidus pauculus]|uniref:Cobalamin biosynthesis protein CbiX n=1 Tax=Cupriavidus pauculus TaxID=82633 RepID=A0A3G8H4F8_9BURK|nr:CbiX/SirB N-terminal domain-containing protein [Cupriavidus pauculus]AZG15304.1 cobalamin biosynthesis protein CbiX [Cupriavidus pauculus]